MRGWMGWCSARWARVAGVRPAAEIGPWFSRARGLGGGKGGRAASVAKLIKLPPLQVNRRLMQSRSASLSAIQRGDCRHAEKRWRVAVLAESCVCSVLYKLYIRFTRYSNIV
jgi:hypothetical protein